MHHLTARADGVVCGLDFALAAFAALDPDVRFLPEVSDGDRVSAVSRSRWSAVNSILCYEAERTALNWLQRLSGTATLTAQAVAAAGSRTKILDTRKTTPGLRPAERYAVRCGGGLNHRDSLASGVLIKDNHIAAVRQAGGTLAEAVAAAIANVGPATGVEVEVVNLDEAREALDAGATSLLLDNFAIDDLPPPSKSPASITPRPRPVVASRSSRFPPSPAPERTTSLWARSRTQPPSLDIALDMPSNSRRTRAC